MENKKTITRSITFDLRTYEKLRSISKKELRSINKMMNLLVEEYIKDKYTNGETENAT